MEQFFNSDNPAVLAGAVAKAIREDKTNPLKKKMREGVDYYNYKHEILGYRLFYYDNDGIMREEKNRSNTKYPHAFFTELVDQKVQYLLSNDINIKVDDEEFQKLLDEYISEDFQLVCQDALEGASQKAYEYIYVYQDDEGLKFKTADSRKVIEVFDAENNLSHIIRYYESEIYESGKRKLITKAELWDKEKTLYFIATEHGKFKVDLSIELNPRNHVLAKDVDGQLYGKGFGYIPFIRLDNNKAGTTDLEPIKGLIDDYDLMACALSNNLVDFDNPLYVVRGFQGDNLDKLITNLKTKKAIGTAPEGGIDVKTVNIPIEARNKKLELDKEGIYKFGMGFDSSQLGDGNITNVVIQSRYSLLDLKCNKAEARLKIVIRRMLELIVDDINRRLNKLYNYKEIKIEIVRDTMVNERDLVEQDGIRAETQGQLLNNILDAANRLDDQTVLKYICTVFDLDFEEVKKSLGEQDFNDVIEDE